MPNPTYTMSFYAQINVGALKNKHTGYQERVSNKKQAIIIHGYKLTNITND